MGSTVYPVRVLEIVSELFMYWQKSQLFNNDIHNTIVERNPFVDPVGVLVGVPLGSRFRELTP